MLQSSAVWLAQPVYARLSPQTKTQKGKASDHKKYTMSRPPSMKRAKLFFFGGGVYKAGREMGRCAKRNDVLE
jgi:hypothetical protein